MENTNDFQLFITDEKIIIELDKKYLLKIINENYKCNNNCEMKEENIYKEEIKEVNDNNNEISELIKMIRKELDNNE